MVCRVREGDVATAEREDAADDADHTGEVGRRRRPQGEGRLRRRPHQRWPARRPQPRLLDDGLRTRQEVSLRGHSKLGGLALGPEIRGCMNFFPALA